MKTQEFLNLLKEHPTKEIHFEYDTNKVVAKGYHVTEVKNVTFDTVDCGGRPDYWKETIVQLWESPLDALNPSYLTAQKILDIFNKVNSIKPLLLETIIKFEYGNKQFHTSVLLVDSFNITENRLTFKLYSTKTACKATDICGVPEKVLAKVSDSCCDPASGCC